MRPLNAGERREPSMSRSHDLSAGVSPSLAMRFRLSTVGRRLAGAGQVLSHLPRPGFGRIAVLVLASTGAYGTALGGHTVEVIDEVAQPLGLSIDRIDVKGNVETSEIDVLQALWQTGAQSLPSLDPEAARQVLEAMPWIANASVGKTYPNHVSINLVERAPFALWQKGRELFVIDRDGGEIVPYSVGRFSSLPFVVGTGANTHAREFLDQLDVLPELRARVKAYIRVGDRRWDLRLENGLTLRLPEDGAVEAAAEVVRMDKEMGLLSRDILVVDMRIEDRMVVRLTPDALVRRDAALKEREKVLKRAQKDKPA